MHQHRKEQPLATREQNERKFPDWVELPDGGRRYWLDFPGRHCYDCLAQLGYAVHVEAIPLAA